MPRSKASKIEQADLENFVFEHMGTCLVQSKREARAKAMGLKSSDDATRLTDAEVEGVLRDLRERYDAALASNDKNVLRLCSTCINYKAIGKKTLGLTKPMQSSVVRHIPIRAARPADPSHLVLQLHGGVLHARHGQGTWSFTVQSRGRVFIISRDAVLGVLLKPAATIFADGPDPPRAEEAHTWLDLLSARANVCLGWKPGKNKQGFLGIASGSYEVFFGGTVRSKACSGLMGSKAQSCSNCSSRVPRLFRSVSSCYQGECTPAGRFDSEDVVGDQPADEENDGRGDDGVPVPTLFDGEEEDNDVTEDLDNKPPDRARTQVYVKLLEQFSAFLAEPDQLAEWVMMTKRVNRWRANIIVDGLHLAYRAVANSGIGSPQAIRYTPREKTTWVLVYSRGRTEFTFWALLLSGPSETTMLRLVPLSSKVEGLRESSVDGFFETLRLTGDMGYRMVMDCQFIRKSLEPSPTTGDDSLIGCVRELLSSTQTTKKQFEDARAQLESLGDSYVKSGEATRQARLYSALGNQLHVVQLESRDGTLTCQALLEVVNGLRNEDVDAIMDPLVRHIQAHHQNAIWISAYADLAGAYQHWLDRMRPRFPGTIFGPDDLHLYSLIFTFICNSFVGKTLPLFPGDITSLADADLQLKCHGYSNPREFLSSEYALTQYPVETWGGFRQTRRAIDPPLPPFVLAHVPIEELTKNPGVIDFSRAMVDLAASTRGETDETAKMSLDAVFRTTTAAKMDHYQPQKFFTFARGGRLWHAMNVPSRAMWLFLAAGTTLCRMYTPMGWDRRRVFTRTENTVSWIKWRREFLLQWRSSLRQLRMLWSSGVAAHNAQVLGNFFSILMPSEAVFKALDRQTLNHIEWMANLDGVDKSGNALHVSFWRENTRHMEAMNAARRAHGTQMAMTARVGCQASALITVASLTRKGGQNLVVWLQARALKERKAAKASESQRRVPPFHTLTKTLTDGQLLTMVDWAVTKSLEELDVMLRAFAGVTRGRHSTAFDRSKDALASRRASKARTADAARTAGRDANGERESAPREAEEGSFTAETQADTETTRRRFNELFTHTARLARDRRSASLNEAFDRFMLLLGFVGGTEVGSGLRWNTNDINEGIWYVLVSNVNFRSAWRNLTRELGWSSFDEADHVLGIALVPWSKHTSRNDVRGLSRLAGMLNNEEQM